MVVLGPGAENFYDGLAGEFERQIGDIGLDPQQDAELLNSEDLMEIDWDAAPVAIWFGKESQPSAADLELLDDFLIRCPNPVFPVCESLIGYTSKVPASLHHVNGQTWEAARVVSSVLKAFNLTRDDRRAFISYCRRDSTAVAHQLFTRCSTGNIMSFWTALPSKKACLFRRF